MIKSPAPFPQPGSFALHGEQLVRILGTDPVEQVAIVSYPLRIGATGNTRLGLSDLSDATALTPAEQAELSELGAKLAGQSRPKKADVAREKALADRVARARILEKHLAEAVRRKLLDRQTAGLDALQVAA